MERRAEGKSVPGVQVARPAPGKGARTRTRLLDLAQDAIIHKGFAATSIDELVEGAGIAKSTFFYHFRDKNDLARQLIRRYMAEDDALYEGLARRAHELSDDPLQAFLIFLRLFAEMLDAAAEEHPGCLVAAVIYQDRAFDREVRGLIEANIRGWRARFHAWLTAAAARHPPRMAVDLEALADQLNVVIDGGIVTARALGEPAVIGRQLRLMHAFVRLLFERG
jgi:AcrR family transcriptional regulator